MQIGLRSWFVGCLCRLGLFPPDMWLLYDDTSHEWRSGFHLFSTVLYALVRSARPDLVVEIGSAYGKSTCFTASALARNGHGRLISIDPHVPTAWNDGDPKADTYRVVQKRLRALRLSAYVEQRRMYSGEAAASWTEPIDMLLIDGSHTYEDVRDDFMGFIPHVREGGLVFFHDTMWEHRDSGREDMGAPKFVQELQDQGFPMVTLRESWGLTILQNAKGGFPLVRPR